MSKRASISPQPGIERAGFAAHFYAAAMAALLLGVFQLILEAVAIPLRLRGYFLAPYEFSGVQMYDVGTKLFMFLPGANRWMESSGLNTFHAASFADKLSVGYLLVIPSLLGMAVLATAVASIRFALRRRVSESASVVLLILAGVLVHSAAWIAVVRVPQVETRAVHSSGWILANLFREAARVFVWEGAYLSLIVLLIAGAAALLITRSRRKPAIAALAAAACMLWALSNSLGAHPSLAKETDALSAREPAVADAPIVDNAILISIDSLRADRLSSYGNPHPTSPVLDGLASRGTRFTEASSATSWTLPSHMSLLTGRDVLSHGVVTDTDRLADTIPTLAQGLHSAGITTGGVVSFGWLDSKYGFARGFDYYDDKTIPNPKLADSAKDEPAAKVVHLASQWITSNADRRFFLFLHFWDVHYDYDPPPPYDTMFDPGYTGSINGVNFYHNPAVNSHMQARDLEHILALYDGEIRWVDDNLSALFSLLDKLGLSQKTAVIVTGDHGDEFFEHGDKGHGRTLYREVTHVPLIIYVPGLKAGQVVDQLVSGVDVMPTLLELLGATPQGTLDGTSLVPALRGEPLDKSAAYGWLCTYDERRNCQVMQHDEDGTMIHRFQPPRIEFYGSSDTEQRNDLAKSRNWSQRGEKLAQLKPRLDRDWDECRRDASRRGNVVLDQGTKDKLRALGYSN